MPALALVTAGRASRLRRDFWSVLAWGSAGATAIANGLYFWLAEGGPADALFALTVTLAVGALIVWVRRRVLVAAVLVVAMVGIIRTISYAKQQATEVLLHAYDVVALLSSWSTLTEVWSQHRGLGLALAITSFASIGVSRIADRIDPTRVPRHYAACAFALLAVLTWTADVARGPRRHTEFYFENAYVTFFYSSWAETAQALWRGRLIEAAGSRSVDPKEVPFQVAESCASSSRMREGMTRSSSSGIGTVARYRSDSIRLQRLLTPCGRGRRHRTPNPKRPDAKFST